MMNDIRYKDVKLNDPVTITVPASVLLGFCAAYASTEWCCWYAARIIDAIQNEILDPVFLRESEARIEAERDKATAFFTGQSPEVPPHMQEGS